METVKIPAGDSHDDALIEELKNPQESAAYLTALFEEEVSEPELFYHIQQRYF